MSEKHFWLTAIFLPLTILVFLPADHSDKLALVALAFSILFIAALKYMPRGSKQAKLAAGLALAMPILSIGGCIKYTFLNSTAKHDFVLFNGSDQPLKIVFDSKKLTLNSRQTIKRTTFSSKLTLTDPATGQVHEMAFSEGLHILAYGAAYELKVTELDYERLSFSSGNDGGGAYSNSRRVRSGMFSMKGDFSVYMPGQEVPRIISRPKHSTTRYILLSIENSQAHPDRPQKGKDVMEDAVNPALGTANELK